MSAAVMSKLNECFYSNVVSSIGHSLCSEPVRLHNDHNPVICLSGTHQQPRLAVEKPLEYLHNYVLQLLRMKSTLPRNNSQAQAQRPQGDQIMLPHHGILKTLIPAVLFWTTSSTLQHTRRHSANRAVLARKTGNASSFTPTVVPRLYCLQQLRPAVADQ
jgi:hypothetical protein